jgi:polar amino acid transport system substrate-binding protein
MKMMKRILAIVMIAATLLALTACGNDKLVVGITDFAPMDYKNDKGEWIGYDADLAKEFAKSLGKEVEFVEIEWDNKILELENGNIDCVWNGMTLTDEVKAGMSTSNPYLKNAQVVVMSKELADQYKTAEDMKELKFAVEKGSAGAEAAADNGFKTTEVIDQATALMEVKAGTSDAAIIDLLMAGAMIGEGTSYENLTFTIELTSEEYGIGFAKDSKLTEKLNAFLKEAYEDGTMAKLAKEYGISDKNIIAQ